MALRRQSTLVDRITRSQLYRSIVRSGYPDTPRNQALVVLGNVYLHLHPVRIRKSGVKLLRCTVAAASRMLLRFWACMLTPSTAVRPCHPLHLCNSRARCHLYPTSTEPRYNDLGSLRLNKGW